MKSEKTLQKESSIKLMDRVTKTLDYYRYAERTKSSYSRWIKEYVVFLRNRKVPEDRFQDEVGSFIQSLEEEKRLSASSRKQALNAIVFLYKRVFQIELDVDIEPAKTRAQFKLPIILTQEESIQLFLSLKGNNYLMAGLMYGAGLRLMECIRLRVHHLDFKRDRILIYPIKNGKIREVVMPARIKPELMDQIRKVKKIHEQDVVAGLGAVEMPFGFNRKYQGHEKEFVWQYVFPAKKTKQDNRTRHIIRSHVGESGIQKAVKTAALKAGISKPVSCSTLRHSFAVHLLENGTDIFKVNDLMGHSDIHSTRLYLKLVHSGYQKIISPLDRLDLETK